MKFSTALLSLAALLSSAEACKCVSSIGNNEPATRACCQRAGGPARSDDCPAGKISNRLSTFAACCRKFSTQTDCTCPIGCVKKELEKENEAAGKAPPTDDEVKALLAQYEDN